MIDGGSNWVAQNRFLKFKEPHPLKKNRRNDRGLPGLSIDINHDPPPQSRQSARLFLQSSKLGPPSPADELVPSPLWFRGGGGGGKKSVAGGGVGWSQ